MKYRWSINVMTRNSGVLTIYCKDIEQAKLNIDRYNQYRDTNKPVISFNSLSQLPNVMLMNEIIAITCCDLQMMYDVAIEDRKLNSELRKEYPTDFSQEESGGY